MTLTEATDRLGHKDTTSTHMSLHTYDRGRRNNTHDFTSWWHLLTRVLWLERTYFKKKHSEDMQTLRAGCSKAEPKIFALPQTPFLGSRDGQNLISWRWPLFLSTNPVWWGSMHAISSYRGNRPTNTATHPQTGPITIHCAAASVQCNNANIPMCKISPHVHTHTLSAVV